MAKKGSLSFNIVLLFQLMTAGLSLFFIVGCHTDAPLLKHTPATQEAKQQENPYAKAEITTKIIPSANNTFGYDILLHGKRLVHQPSIPGLPDNEGFATKEKAQTVADFVARKIRNNEMPPTVTVEDLNNMGVLK